METELILTLLDQAPIIGVVAILYMMKRNEHQKVNGNGANTELMRSISSSLLKMAEAQVEANQIAERRARGFERWLDLQNQNPFQSRNPKN
jgi:hypothetical protein